MLFFFNAEYKCKKAFVFTNIDTLGIEMKGEATLYSIHLPHLGLKLHISKCRDQMVQEKD